MSERTKAIAYFRTSSATGVGEDKDSLPRQERACRRYAAQNKIEIVESFYDAAVSGADAVTDRPGFNAMLDRIRANGVKLVLIEDASRFARDLFVQIVGHDHLKRMGVELIAVNAPDHFREDTPTAVMVRQILGAVSQFQKNDFVVKSKAARDRKRVLNGRCEGRKPTPPEVVASVRKLARINPKTHKRRSLREIASILAERGLVKHLENGTACKPYSHEAVRQILAKA